MKIALYIEDGLEQIVLTPETKTEKGIVAKLTGDLHDMTIKRGSFYDCNGGWKRQTKTYPNWSGVTQNDKEDDSTIIVLRPKPPTSPSVDQDQSA